MLGWISKFTFFLKQLKILDKWLKKNTLLKCTDEWKRKEATHRPKCYVKMILQCEITAHSPDEHN